MERLSFDEARKLVLLSQKLPPVKGKGSTVAATLAAIEHLGYIQIDTISVIQRAHHHTLWNRNPRYKLNHIDKLIRDKRIFEYWSHAAAYLPMRDFRYSLPRKYDMKNGNQKHWYTPDKTMMKEVLRRIESEGPLMAKDFDHGGVKTGEWRSKPAKQALEYLFMQGDLMIPYRVNFHKVYDLTERAIPEGINTKLPTSEEYAEFLIIRYLEANGLAQVSEISYLLKNIKSSISSVARGMVENGDLVEVGVGDNNYYMLPSSLELLDRPLSRSKLKILSPFDNLLIQRKRMEDLFGFDYQIECYLPEAKRQYGYFSLPLLWNGRLVARMDCKADRKSGVLYINHLAVESWLRKTDGFIQALLKEITSFMEFNSCSDITLHKTTPPGFTSLLQEGIDSQVV